MSVAMSASGMVRPVLLPRELGSWQEALKTRSTPCLRYSTPQS